MDAWIKEEIAASDLGDKRLNGRLARLLEQFSGLVGAPIPLACQDWAGAKAAYRSMDNPRVQEGDILAGHFKAPHSRLEASSGLTMVLHDTTEFSFQRANTQAIGMTGKSCGRKEAPGRYRMHTVCGMLMHSSLAVTQDGLPLGLAAAKFWTRKKFKGTNALKGKINATRVPIADKESIRWLENLERSTDLLGDPGRCVHIADREADIFELFCAALQAQTHFVVRTCVNRLAGNGRTTIDKVMAKVKPTGIHVVEVVDKRGRTSTARLQVRYARMKVHPPIGKGKRYPVLELTVIHAREISAPKGRAPISWKLLTDLPVASLAQACEKLDWYAMRWKIETFHKILKSGCKAEESLLRNAHRLVNLLALLCIVAWRVFWLCMVKRTSPQAPAHMVFTPTELELLRRLSRKQIIPKDATISDYLLALAKLGGYLARKRDHPPGNKVIWRGMIRLMDIHLGYCIAKGDVGN
jgi:hypothetical protein